MQALLGAQKGVQMLQDKGVPWLRPPDYYAEMVKSDGHMANIKQRLVYEQKQIEEAEERYTSRHCLHFFMVVKKLQETNSQWQCLNLAFLRQQALGLPILSSKFSRPTSKQ